MELHVTETEGIPEGCVLSVRAGATRRQAPVTADRPFRFPISPAEASPFKVDVLEPVATARLILRPGEEQRTDCQYTIPLERVGAPEGEVADGSVNVTIAVRPIDDEKEKDEKGPAEAPIPKRSIGGSSASSRHGQASAAREYLDQHNLVEFTQLLVQSVIKEQPDRPYAFMAKQFYFPDPKPRPKTCPADTAVAARADVAAASPSGEAEAAATAAAAVAPVGPAAPDGGVLPSPPHSAGFNLTGATAGLGATASGDLFNATVATAGFGEFHETGAIVVPKTDSRTKPPGEEQKTGSLITPLVQDVIRSPVKKAEAAFDEEFVVADAPVKTAVFLAA